MKGDLSTAHPSILADGTLLNFTRSLPYGGFHIYKQDPHTLKRTEVGMISCLVLKQHIQLQTLRVWLRTAFEALCSG